MPLPGSPHWINSLAGYRIQGCKSPSKTVVEKSNVILYPDPLYISCFCFSFFSFLEVFNIPFIPGFLTICLDVGLFIICCVKHVLDSDKETRDFSSGNIMLYYFLEYCLPCVFSIFSLFGTLTTWTLNILDGSCNFLMFLSYFQSIYPFVLLSESSPRVPNVVLFKTLFWSVNFHFQELCVILSLILHCSFLHSDVGFLDAISSHLSDITRNFLKSKKHIENGSLRIR